MKKVALARRWGLKMGIEHQGWESPEQMKPVWASEA